MVLTANGEMNGGIEESNDSRKVKSPLHSSVSQKGLISDINTQHKLPDDSSALPKRWFLNFGSMHSQSLRFQRLAEEKDQISRAVPSSNGHPIRDRINRVFSRKIEWASLWKMFKEWIKDPLNMALSIWILGVVVSGALLFLVMTGMLNGAIKSKSERDAWFEVNNQILNALFTLMCLYHHPKRIHHFVLLLRWRPEDISRLRKVYCKNGTYKPHEWTHMLVVILLLNLNCFAQYALCGLNLGYKRSQRPAIGVGITISVAIGAPAIAGVYSILSPLGKDYHSEVDEESQLSVTTAEDSQTSTLRRKSMQKRFSFAIRDGTIVETRPLWSGGVLDFWDDISSAYLSLFCSFCVFGWNMERLGFGNMYVHIATFILFCLAPFFIFGLAAVNINNEAVREALGVTGVFLCVFGLFYGGFWRIQMRKRFNLPPYTFCCGKPDVADCTLWLFCCWCSLAQEVRTANSYDIVEDKFFRKQEDESVKSPVYPLPREGRDIQISPGPSSSLGNSYSPSHITKANSPSPRRLSKEFLSPDRHLASVEEEFPTSGKDQTMTPPSPSHIRRDSN